MKIQARHVMDKLVGMSKKNIYVHLVFFWGGGGLKNKMNLPKVVIGIMAFSVLTRQ